MAIEFLRNQTVKALWHFNETSGSTVADSSGNGNNGTATGTTIVDSVSGFGKAREFNGTSDKIIVPHDASLNFSTELTIEAIITPYEIDPYHNSHNMVIVSKNPSGSGVHDFAFGLNAGRLYIAYEGTNTSRSLYRQDNVTMEVNHTYRVVATLKTSPEEVHLYIGEVGSTISEVSGSWGGWCHNATGNINNHNEDLVIGSGGTVDIDCNAQSDKYFHGVIDELRLSNNVKTLDAIKFYHEETNVTNHPKLTNRNPRNTQTCVNRDNPIQFSLKKQSYDVDITSLRVIVEGTDYQYGDSEISYYGDSDEYNISVTVPQFDYLQTVNVTVLADTTDGNHPFQESYSYIVEFDPTYERDSTYARIELYESGDYDNNILTYQENWVRQGVDRESGKLEVWWGRYQKLPFCTRMTLRVRSGNSNDLGKEVVDNGYLYVKVGDSGDWVQLLSDTEVDLGYFWSHTYQDIYFKLSIPDGASTVRYFTVELVFEAQEASLYGAHLYGQEVYACNDANIKIFTETILYRAYVFYSSMWNALLNAGFSIS